MGGPGRMSAVTLVLLAKAMATKDTRDLRNSMSKDVMKVAGFTASLCLAGLWSEGNEQSFKYRIWSLLTGKSWKIRKAWQKTGVSTQ
jgi:hypothetical protein